MPPKAKPKAKVQAKAKAEVRKVLFATNRKQLGSTGKLPAFGDEPGASGPSGLIFATASVQGVTVDEPSSGKITAISKLYSTRPSEDDLAPILASKNNILVFVHGAANKFSDSITRAAYNQKWLSEARIPGVSTDFDMIAFSWPGREYQFWNLIGDVVDYKHDQGSARHSGDHLALFFAELYKLRARIGSRRMSLLCHSMGNFALGGAVEKFFRGPAAPNVPLFDEAILAAPDEIATTFEAPNGGRLSNLPRLAKEITVYSSRDDIAMDLSHTVNGGGYRLGYDGPANKSDRTKFPVKTFEFVDCSGVNDYINSFLGAPDREHQYYRQSPTVRADIAANLAGLVPVRPKYNQQRNSYILFP